MPDDRDVGEFVAWAREAAIHIREPLDLADPELLSRLDPLIDGKRVAFVGEANHFVAEKYGYRLLLLRYLVSRGFRFVAEELAWSDGLAVDRYVQTGDESHLDRVTAYGYSPRRDDRDDSPTGVLAEGEENYPRDAFRAAQAAFDRAVRDVARSLTGDHPLPFFGFDADYVPAVGYEHVDALLDRIGGLEPVRGAFARRPGESRAEESARLHEAVGVLERLLRERGPDDAVAKALRRSAWTLRESFDYAAAANHATSYEALREPMAHRERIMVEHARRVLDDAGPDGRVVFFSHNLHLARDDDAIVSPPGGVGPGGGLAPSVGHALSRSLPGAVFSVWMLEAEGSDSQPFVSAGRTVAAAAGSLNAILAQAGEVFLLPMSSADRRSDLLARPQTVTMMYGSSVKLVPRDQVDAICFVRRVSPLPQPQE